METLLTTLRSATRSQHADLEKITLLPESLGSATDLRRVLSNFYGYYQTLDRVIKESSKANLPEALAQPLQRSVVLEQDLTVLGFDEAGLSALPACTDVPHFPTPWHQWGAHYVIEGSALGGKVVTKHMLKQTSLNPLANRIRFFDVYGDSTAVRWKSFVGQLGGLSLTPVEQSCVVEGAQSVFRTLTNWLELNPAGHARVALSTEHSSTIHV